MDLQEAVALLDSVDAFADTVLIREAWQTVKAAVSAQTAHNTARDKICHCEHREGWLAFKHSWVLDTIVYCPSCSGKLSPVA